MVPKSQKFVNVVCERPLRALLVLAVSPFRIDSAIQSSCIIGSVMLLLLWHLQTCIVALLFGKLKHIDRFAKDFI